MVISMEVIAPNTMDDTITNRWTQYYECSTLYDGIQVCDKVISSNEVNGIGENIDNGKIVWKQKIRTYIIRCGGIMKKYI